MFLSKCMSKDSNQFDQTVHADRYYGNGYRTRRAILKGGKSCTREIAIIGGN